MRRLLVPLFATLVLGALLLAVVDLRVGALGAAVRQRLASCTPGPLLLAFAVYALSYFGRAIRFAILMPGLRDLPHLASVAARHNFLNLVLPFRSGEVALPWLLMTEAGRPLAEGTAALLVCRVLDLLCVATYAAAGLALSGIGQAAPDGTSAQLAFAFAGLLGVLLALRPVAKALAPRLRRGEGRLRRFAAGAADHLVSLAPLRLSAAAVASLATWLLTYATFWFLLRAMAGMDPADPVGRSLGAVDFPTSLVGSSALHLSTVLPVNTVGGLGSWELSWTAGYLVAGLDRQAAGVSGIVTHLVIFGFVTVLGGLGFLFRKRPTTPGSG